MDWNHEAVCGSSVHLLPQDLNPDLSFQVKKKNIPIFLFFFSFLNVDLYEIFFFVNYRPNNRKFRRILTNMLPGVGWIVWEGIAHEPLKGEVVWNMGPPLIILLPAPMACEWTAQDL